MSIIEQQHTTSESDVIPWLKEAKAAVHDLAEPSPIVYWADLLITTDSGPRFFAPPVAQPIDPNVDPIDWVERIPFSETRNYVQRVMENLQVYRVRFGGGSKLLIGARGVYRVPSPT
jgi:hypothetical protein